MSDPGITYRTREEVDEVRASRDPINLVRKKLIDNNLLTEDEITSIESGIKKDLNAAAQRADDAPYPDIKETYTQVYVEPTSIRGVELSQSYHV